MAEGEGFRRLADLADAFPDWASMGHFAKAEFLRAQRDRTVRFLRAHPRGLQEVQRNPEAGIAILQERLKYERPAAEAGHRELSRSPAADARTPVKRIEFLIGEELKAGNLASRAALHPDHFERLGRKRFFSILRSKGVRPFGSSTVRGDRRWETAWRGGALPWGRT